MLCPLRHFSHKSNNGEGNGKAGSLYRHHRGRVSIVVFGSEGLCTTEDDTIDHYQWQEYTEEAAQWQARRSAKHLQ